MLNIFNYNAWSRLKADENDPIKYLALKKNILFTRFCIMASIAAFIQAGYDLWDGFPIVMSFDLFIAVFLIIGYILNERGYHTQSKVFVFVLANVTLFLMASVVPKGVGVYLLFYPLIVFTIIAFDYHQRIYTYLFALGTIVLQLMLVVTHYQPLGSINLQPSDPTVSFILNVITSFLLIGVGIDFLKSLNYKAENQLVELQSKTAQLAQELQVKNEALEKSNKELDQFVYSTSHDLRAPLTSITGILNLIRLEKFNLPNQIHEYHARIENSILGLTSFIKDILEYSRNSRTVVNKTAQPLDTLINEVVEHASYLEQAKHIKITTNVPINETVKLDKTRTFSVLSNLVSNAVKYHDITKPNPYIVIEASINEAVLTISVKDNGEGICAACQPRIFEMFYRGTENSTGSGLGLYITKEMSEKMGGSIRFTSKQGEGSTFSLSLPV